MADQPFILIADDEPEILALYTTKLTRAGFRVMTVPNGEEAIAAAKKERPDLVLMDVKMPVMDGVAAQQKLKEDPETKDLKIVFLTAFSDPAHPEVDEVFAKESGATAFIRKGINLDELVAKVREYLGVS